MGETGTLGSDLAALEAALEDKRRELQDSIGQVERDLDAVRGTKAAARRMSFAGTPRLGQHTVATPLRLAHNGQPSPIHKITRFPDERPEVLLRDRLAEAEKELQPARQEPRDEPPVRDGVPTANAAQPRSRPDLQAVREGLRDIVDRVAAEVPAGKLGRRITSAKGLVHGEPLAPALRVILEVADRPLTTYEVAVALLETRGISLEGKKMTAVVSRASALLAMDRKKGTVLSYTPAGGRTVLWVSGSKGHLLPELPEEAAGRATQQADAAASDIAIPY